jgi:hypothetical protein
MADTKISDLTAASALTGAEEFPCSDGTATTKAATVTQIKTLVNNAPVFAAGTASASTWPKLTSGTLLTTTEAGALEFDGQVPYFTPVVGDRGIWPAMLFRALSADATGSDSATAQGWFPTNGAVAVRASTTYFFEGALSIVRTAGATSHTTGISMDGGTCTFNSIGYIGHTKEGDAATISDGDLIAIQVATDTNIKAASTATTENIVVTVRGIAFINAAGTFKPMFKYSAAPGGAPTIEKGSFFLMFPIGSTGGVTRGTWS